MLWVSKKRAKKIIQFIKDCKSESGFTPSVASISKKIELSYDKTHSCLKNMANNNYIVYTGNNAVWISPDNKVLDD